MSGRTYIMLMAVAGGVFASSAVLAQSTSSAAATPADSGKYVRPGDIVRLRIWREPDLSGDFPVDNDGFAIFPKLGPYSVVTQAPEALRDSLVSAYQVFLRNPSIDVTLLRRVNILGAVQKPGLYPIDQTMTLADALALAGGANPQGDPDKVDLLRGGQRLRENLSRRTALTDLPLRSGDQLYVPERRWVSRNLGAVAAFVTASATLFIAIRR